MPAPSSRAARDAEYRVAVARAADAAAALLAALALGPPPETISALARRAMQEHGRLWEAAEHLSETT